MEGAWKGTESLTRRLLVRQKILNTALALKNWNRNVFGFCQSRVLDLKDKLQRIQRINPTDDNLLEEQSLQWELDEWRKRLELLWRQKSRELWINVGDRNTKFFHASTVANRKKIFIPALRDSNGTWKTTRSEVGNLLVEEFIKLFKADHLRRSERMGEFIQSCITYEDNRSLKAIPSEAEIWNVVKGMHPTKSPGPDGMSAVFS
ncbi:uncharacterized protein LOC132799408 [Ziziphus jujuba]|uniref:Uncharacterized protein LOC132799408 n=1 Tax=Ziziphus jujuba TaxID=326968 RepID=A0ABM3ZRT1_ZIZJJ|nr:uncharacterized protein LOC132799408 [Ziziphus jujuba]